MGWFSPLVVHPEVTARSIPIICRTRGEVVLAGLEQQRLTAHLSDTEERGWLENSPWQVHPVFTPQNI